MKLFDKLLDLSIVRSFDRSGFERHRERFCSDEVRSDISERKILITGANSGLGRATTEALARLGARVWMLCRDLERGETARDCLVEATGSSRITLALVDVSDLRSVSEFVRGWDAGPIDGLIHNAGILTDAREMTADGLEKTWATHVVGPFALTRGLRPWIEQSTDARVVTVSSGGMYTQRLDLSDLDWTRRPFNGVVAYAQAKRAQVVLNELWAEHTRRSGIVFHAMHPGWVDTPGVRSSLPKFYRWMKRRLRSAEQGSDSIVWLAASRSAAFCNGCFWFDRRRVATHLLPWTRESIEQRDELWNICSRHEISHAGSSG